MGVKAEKLTREGNLAEEDFIQDTVSANKAVVTRADHSSLSEDVNDQYVLPLEQADVSRQEEVETIFDSIFGRVGCYNCGLVGLDINLSPEDILRFDSLDTQAPSSGVNAVGYDS